MPDNIDNLLILFVKFVLHLVINIIFQVPSPTSVPSAPSINIVCPREKSIYITVSEHAHSLNLLFPVCAELHSCV